MKISIYNENGTKLIQSLLKRRQSNYLLVLLCACLFSACSPDTSYEVLSFFFDGVPDPNQKVVVQSDSIIRKDSSKNQVISVVSKEVRNVHPPYMDRDCAACHDPNRRGKFVVNQPDLCYTCHTDFLELYNNLHAPAESGNCTQCHHPHVTNTDYLLKRSNQDLCSYCHKTQDVYGNKIHAGQEDKNCLECHNPHGGDNRFVLREKACYQCHEDFTKKFKHVHNPVEANYCATCHDAHASKKPKLLLNKPKTLCLSCHEQDQIVINPIHKKYKKQDCIACHNPHGGEDVNFLDRNKIQKFNLNYQNH